MSEDRRLAHLDSLRAIAALLVVWSHAAEVFAPLAGGSWLWNLANTYDLGRVGVVAFFGVSGFLIPTSLADQPPQGAAGRFLVKRFFRLFPAYWLSIPIGVATLWSLFGRPISASEVALNVTMVPDLFGARPVMGSYWTLEYELTFYGLCLLLFQVGLLRRGGVLAAATAIYLGVFVLGFAALAVTRRQAPGDLAMVSLNCGVLFLGALWRRQCDGETARLEKLALAGALALIWIATPAVCAFVIYGYGSHNPFFVRFPAAYAVGVALFIAMTSIAKVTWRPLAWVGLISYSLYLLHPAPIYLLRYAFDHGAPGAHWPTLIQVTLATAGGLGLAAVGFYVVEQPALDYGRRLTRSAGQGAARPAVVGPQSSAEAEAAELRGP